MESERLNKLLSECEIELSRANESLSELMEEDNEGEEFTEQINFLLERIHQLTGEFESLMQML